jgi:amino acid adenylation domain-containing protein/thioester reductase-like protein
LLQIGERERFPLSAAQNRLFLEQQLEPESTAYNIPLCWRIDGPLDGSRLEAALRQLARRHASLRTAILMQGGEPGQQVREHADATLQRIAVSRQEWETGCLNRLRGFVRPFDLSQAPLLRAAVLSLDGDHSLFALDVHHIVCDGKSLAVLLGDLSRLYAGERLSPLTFACTDYAEWERHYLASPLGEAHAIYWKGQYREPFEPLRLPYNKPATAAKRQSAQRHEFSFDAERSQRLIQWADSHKVTLFTGLFALYQLLWHRSTGQTDFVVGTASAERHHAELQSHVGMFVSTLAIRLATRGSRENDQGNGLTLAEWVQQANRQLLDAYEHQLYPYDRLVRHVRRHHDAEREQLFDAAFVWQNAGSLSLELPGLSTTRLPGLDHDAKFELLLEGEETEGRLHFRFEYSQERFHPDTLAQLADDFAALADWAAASEGDIPIHTITLPSVAKRAQLIRRFNDTNAEYPREQSLPAIFKEQAELYAQNIAVAHGTQAMTYAALGRRAEALACRLREQGVVRGQVVGVMLPRSIDYIASLLAVLKAGGAYLPLDSELPFERTRYMLEDSGTRHILTTAELADRLKSLSVQTVLTDAEGSLPAMHTVAAMPESATPAMPAAQPNHEPPGPRDLAYVLYTSGSTGLPKGVMIEHRSIVRLVRGANYIELRPGQDKIMQAGALGFDASTFEIWGALLNGGTLVLADKDDLLEADRLQQVVARHGVTIMLLTSPLFHQLAAQQAELFAPLRALLVGGDIVLPHIAREVRSRCPDTQLINVYGPTENTTFSACFTIDQDYEDSIPIGYPVSNSTAYIVGSHGQLLGVGETGELWVGGDGVARGYLNRPKLTAEKFVESPFRAGERLYKTGDLAKWLPGGAIEFLGRMDRQVKINGYRIEIGEIEQVLLRHEAIREAVVLVGGSGQTHNLCAFYTAERAVPAAEASVFAGIGLPTYMIPHVWVQLDRMPLTTNGKIDVRALIVPESTLTARESGEDGQTGTQLPVTETEKRLLPLWREALESEAFGIDDHFFRHGGHSLTAMRLIAALNSEFGLRLPVRRLFENPTVRRLAACIEADADNVPSGSSSWEAAREAGAGEAAGPESQAAASFEAAPLTAAPLMPSYPLTHPQQRLFFTHLRNPEGRTYNMPMLWRWKADERNPAILDRHRLEAAVRELVRRHEAFRTSFHLEEGEPVQRIHPSVDIPVSEILLSSPGELDAEVRTFVRPFDLAEPPLLRVAILRTTNLHGEPAPTDFLLLDMHHLIADGASVELFLEQLAQRIDGVDLPVQVPVQPREVAVWQQRYAQTVQFRQQQAYWQSQYAEEVPSLRLPLDKPRPAQPAGEGDRVTVTVDPSVAGKLKRLANECSATMFMLLFSVYNVWLSKYGQQTDLVVGTPAAGRRAPELRHTIGMLVNTLAIRSRPLADKRFLDFLDETIANIAQALENQEYPLERLIQHAVTAREPGRNPLFDTMFVHASELSGLGNARFASQTIKANWAKFDLLVEADTRDDELAFHLEYDTALFERATVDAMAIRFLHVLQTIAADPAIRLAEIGLVCAKEKTALLAFNPPEQSYAYGRTVLELLEESFSANGERIAAVDSHIAMTYRELRSRANRVARALAQHGIGCGKIVALISERSVEALVAIIGIMKCGAVYLPIERMQPKERIERILAEAEAAAAIVENDLRTALKTDSALLDLTELLQQQDDHDMSEARRADDLTYLIFTSGSTGRPKGVMIGEKSFANAVEWHRQFYRISAEDRSTQYASLGFDASILEIFPYLIAGAALHIIPDTLKLDIPGLNGYFEEHGITVSFLPTQIAESFMQLENRSLRLLLTAGDKLTQFVPQRYAVYNNYGPTENTVVASCHHVQHHEPNLPIGRPAANSRLYVLDPYGQLLPPGLPGELYIAGVGLARGYWRMPELTERSFVPDPFVPGETMYRTGDKVQWRADGTLEIFGRLDEQIKIRGNRVELGEVEQVVGLHPAVSRAVVFAIGDEGGDGSRDKALYACFLASREVPRAEWEAYCGERLPGYMIPSRFIQRDVMPLTPNGKVDRRRMQEEAYSALRGHTITDQVQAVDPRDRLEASIVDVFREVLGTPVGIDDNFFENGGDSIKAIRVVARLAEQFDVRINDLFEHQTAAGLKRHVRWRNDRIDVRKDGATALQPARASLSALKEEFRTYKARIAAEQSAGKSARDLARRRENDPFHCILLTGATGYFGIHLLHTLLKQTTSRICLLVREKKSEAAASRVIDLWTFTFDVPFAPELNRVSMIAGDIAAERLGLSDDTYRKLAEEVDCIIHCAAKTQHYGFREEFERINVAGTELLLQLAATGRNKSFYYMSTLSVASAGNLASSRFLFTEYSPPDKQTSENYYIATKWEAENKVVQHRERGHHASIVRLGNIVFHSETGRFQRNIDDNAFYGLMRAWLVLGKMPDSSAKSLDFSFVDCASMAVATIVSNRLSDPFLHVSHPRPISYRQLANWINLAENKSAISRQPANELIRDVSIAYKSQKRDNGELADALEKVLLEQPLAYAGNHREAYCLSYKSNAKLQELGFTWPALQPKHIELMLSYGRQVGFIRF